MAYDDGSPPDDLANAAGEISTEIGVGPDENGDGTSADAPASPLAETARVQIAYPTPPPVRWGSHTEHALGAPATAQAETSSADTVPSSAGAALKVVYPTYGLATSGRNDMREFAPTELEDTKACRRGLLLLESTRLQYAMKTSLVGVISCSPAPFCCCGGRQSDVREHLQTSFNRGVRALSLARTPMLQLDDTGEGPHAPEHHSLSI